jgi:hypothetical protein
VIKLTITKGEKVSEYKKYVSYFQKVTTIGILTCGKDYDEAMDEAKLIIKDTSSPNRCFYDETGFDYSDTEEWNPAVDIISIDPDGDSLNMTISMNDKYTEAIAKSLGKSIGEVTEEDCQNFVKEALTSIVEKNK